jgi:hypothetical protein
VNPLPAAGSIQITYPTQITLIDGTNTKCTVVLIDEQGAAHNFDSSCQIDNNANTITI